MCVRAEIPWGPRFESLLDREAGMYPLGYDNDGAVRVVHGGRAPSRSAWGYDGKGGSKHVIINSDHDSSSSMAGLPLGPRDIYVVGTTRIVHRGSVPSRGAWEYDGAGGFKRVIN